MAELEIRNISKTYRSGKIVALSKVNLTITQGLFGLLGPNGAGKTTLMRILATVLKPDEGEIVYGEHTWRNAIDIGRNIGYIPQNFSINKYLGVREALVDIALFKGICKRDRMQAVDTAIEKSNMTKLARQRIGLLSEGELSRLSIAQAMLGEPKLMIVDEPAAGLDHTEKTQFRKLLRDYAVGQRIVLISSHIVDDIESLCDQVAILDKGSIIIQGAVKEICALSEGRVVEQTMPQKEYLELENSHCMIASHPEGADVSVRYLLTADEESASIVPSRLEDSYILLIGGGKI